MSARFHVCTSCRPPHIDNCPDCFGYGFGPGEEVIRAGAAELMRARGDDGSRQCETCGSDFNGFRQSKATAMADAFFSIFGIRRKE